MLGSPKLCNFGGRMFLETRPNESGTKTEAELKKLVETGGVQVIHLSRWHYRIGPVHLWLAVGRWLNEDTGWRGKINRMSLSELLGRQLPSSTGVVSLKD